MEILFFISITVFNFAGGLTTELFDGENVIAIIDTITKYKTEAKTWTYQGSMLSPRSAHAVTVVNFDEVSQFCNEPLPVINGAWGEWGTWSSCSVTCGEGTQTRTRECNNPVPANGGSDCGGDSSENRSCTEESCPTTTTTTTSTTTTTTTVTTTSTSTTTTDTSSTTITTTTTTPTVPTLTPIDGNWGQWSEWSDCSNSCGDGTQTRTRECSDPAPENGGADCEGDDNESRTCNLGDCLTGTLMSFSQLTFTRFNISLVWSISDGPVQKVIAKSLTESDITDEFIVALSRSSKYQDQKFSFLWDEFNAKLTGVDISQDMETVTEGHECAKLRLSEDQKSIVFESVDCVQSRLKPLCQRVVGESIIVTQNPRNKPKTKCVKNQCYLTWLEFLFPKAKSPRRMMKKIMKGRLPWKQRKFQKKRKSGFQVRTKKPRRKGRQFLETNQQDVDMCLAVPILTPVITTITSGITPVLAGTPLAPLIPAPVVPPAAPVVPPPPPPPAVIPPPPAAAPPLAPAVAPALSVGGGTGTVTTTMLTSLNPVQNYDSFLQEFPRTFDSPGQFQARAEIFEANLASINAHNTQFLLGAATFSVVANEYSDMTFNEFMEAKGGVGLFTNNANDVPAAQQTKGELPVNPQLPDSLDFSEITPNFKPRNQVCNNCAAHAAISATEYCLFIAGERNLTARSVQQVSECTDGVALDTGSPIERTNTFCESGFPDVHMDYIINNLDGRLDSESNNPESNEKSSCRDRETEDSKREVSNYFSDIFTTEDYLLDALSQFGPTATNIAVTPMLQFYGGGIYYNPEECSNYVEEEVPEKCRVSRGGRNTYTCVTTENGIDCADLMPQHCDIFFKPSDTSYHHSVTVVGYGEEEDGTQFWKIKNSWGVTWGEEGYFKLARGLGHCSFGTFFTVPQC